MAYIYLSWIDIIAILLFALSIEHFFIYIKNEQHTSFSFSSLSTAIGIILMMVTTTYYIYFIVLTFALAQKQFMQYKGKHFFNPSNFALILGLLLFYKESHLVLGQLSDENWLMVIVVFMALWVLYRAKRLLIPFIFIVSYIAIQMLLLINYDPVMNMDHLYEHFYSVSFIVFIFFMLTDPRTTPNSYIIQVIFALSLAFASTLLDYYNGFRVQHLFMILFLFTPIAVFFDLREDIKENKVLRIYFLALLVLVLGAIIYIEMQPPYYLAMD